MTQRVSILAVLNTIIEHAVGLAGRLPKYHQQKWYICQRSIISVETQLNMNKSALNNSFVDVTNAATITANHCCDEHRHYYRKQTT